MGNRTVTLLVLEELETVCFSESKYARSVLGYMLSNVTVFPLNGF